MAPFIFDILGNHPFLPASSDFPAEGPPMSLDDFMAQFMTPNQFPRSSNPIQFNSNGQLIPRSSNIAQASPMIPTEHFDISKYTFRDAGVTLYDLSKPIPLIKHTKGAHIAVSKDYKLAPGRCMVKLYLPIDIGMETERVKQYTIEMWKDEIEHLGLRTKVYSKRDDDKDGSNRKKRVKKAKVAKKLGIRRLSPDALILQMPIGYRRRGIY